MNILILASALAGLASQPAAPDPTPQSPPAGPSVYPVTARLTLSRDAASACIAGGDSGCLVALGDRARLAYEQWMGNLFRPVAEGATPDLEIVVTSILGEIATTSGSRTATVVTRTKVVSPRTGEIDEFRGLAHAPLPARGDESVAGAALQAVDDSVRSFARSFARSEKVARWLLGRGVRPADPSVIHSSYPLTARLSLQPQAASACVPDEASKCLL